jgi:hypothetical protein
MLGSILRSKMVHKPPGPNYSVYYNYLFRLSIGSVNSPIDN